MESGHSRVERGYPQVNKTYQRGCILNYVPQIDWAGTRQRIPLGRYTAVLLSDIHGPGPVQYQYILGLLDNKTDEPCLYVTSEVNESDSENRSGSHFLCVFPGDGHENLGASDDWAEVSTFLERALEIVEERFVMEADA